MPRDDGRRVVLGRRGPTGRGAATARAAARPSSAAIRLGIAALVLVLAQIPRDVAATQEPAPPALVVLLASDRTEYGPGTPARFTLAVDNPGQAAVTATFPSGQVYDVVVLSGDAEVWRWSAAHAFPAAMSERSFPPGVTLLGREVWDWRDVDGMALPPGTYRVVGSLASVPPVDGNAVEIVLTGP